MKWWEGWIPTFIMQLLYFPIQIGATPIAPSYLEFVCILHIYFKITKFMVTHITGTCNKEAGLLMCCWRLWVYQEAQHKANFVNWLPGPLDWQSRARRDTAQVPYRAWLTALQRSRLAFSCGFVANEDVRSCQIRRLQELPSSPSGVETRSSKFHWAYHIRLLFKR
jgi:hypothetical protein